MKRLCLAFVGMMLPLAAAAEGQSGFGQLTWRSTPGDTAAQTREITTLYVALYNGGFLETRTVEIGKGQYLEPLLLQEGVIVGRGVAPALNAMLCDMNPQNCRRVRNEVSASQFEKLDTHIGGYAVSSVRWLYGPGDEIRIPNYELLPNTALRRVPVERSWSPSQFVASDDLNCQAWQTNCDELVELLNPKVFKSDSTQSATLPVTYSETTIELPFNTESESGFDRKLQSRTVIGKTEVRGEFSWSPSYSRFAASTVMTELVLDTLGKNINRVGDVRKSSAPDDTFFEQQKGLFELLKHPLANANELPPAYRHPIKILVLDEPFDNGHCDLSFEPSDSADAPPTPETVDCAGLSEQPPHPIRDHAPHVIGLINAPLNGRGIVGINPYSKVIFGGINKQFSNDADFLDMQIKLQIIAARKGSRVANLSWGYPSSLDDETMKRAVEAVAGNMLVVVAAGNQAENLETACVWMPACLHDEPNVLTVVGIDRQEDTPALWRDGDIGTNTHPQFHIAAVADSVLSTIGENKMGMLSGTSQAAPQVSATASLIFSAAQDLFPEIAAGNQVLAPKVVKDRIVYTSDLYRSLRPSVMGGRLNVARAINIVDTQVVLKRKVEGSDTETEEVAFNGTLFQPPSGNQLMCRQADGTDVAYHWSTIRRLSYDPDRRRYVVFRHDAGVPTERVQAPLERITDCKLATRSNEAILETDAGDITFQLKDVIDYTSALYE